MSSFHRYRVSGHWPENWEVGHKEKAKAYEKLGILGITTDRPGLLKQALRAAAK